MFALRFTAYFLSILLFAVPALALECSNIGTTWAAQPDDTGDAGATACGDGAVAGGNDGTALGFNASAAGSYATALGKDAAAAGANSIALGFLASSAGDYSIAVGSQASAASNSITLGAQASAAGSYSISMGVAASAAGNDATALGVIASAAGYRGTAIGYQAAAGGDFSTALGNVASATSNYGTALGYFARAEGSYSTALGDSAQATGESGTALGFLASASGLRATALGYLAYAPNPNTVVLGAIAGVNSAADYADIAIGTTNPTAPLHVTRADGTAEIFVEETNPAVGPRTLFTLANPGNTKFEIMNTATGNSWAFTNSGNDFRISLQGSGIIEFRVDNFGNAFVANDLEVGGNLVAGGDIITNVLLPSDRGLKRAFEAIDPETVLGKVAALSVTTWEYADRPGERHLGPMAQDFHAAFGLGNGDTTISVLDASGVALASIRALEARTRKFESQNRELVTRNAALEDRLSAMEQVFRKLATRVEHMEATEQENTELENRVASLEAIVTNLPQRTAQK